jgi:hypothetical protein
VRVMEDWRQPPLVLLAIAGLVVLIGQIIAPGLVESGVGGFEQTFSDLPQPVVLGAISLVAIGVWLSMMYVAGRLLYFVWRQIDDYVLSVWDLILPEHPFIRFGAGVTIMLFLFVFGPMAVLTQTDLLEDGDQVQIEGNDTTDDETETPAQNETESAFAVVTSEDFVALGSQTVG